MASKAVYCDYFGFSQDPFSIAPDPALLYPSEQHKQALAHLKYGLDREGGFILLTGEVGTGKTTLTRLLLQQVAGNVRVAYVLNTKLGSEGLLFSICQELEIELPDSARQDISQSIEYLNKDLIAAHAQNKKTLVVIEEAQNLGPEVLETLRLLTNLETNTTKLLHILLVAQPELLDTLARQNLRQLNQRVVSRHHLLPLELSDVSHYLNHRVTKVGGQANLFTSQAIKRLYSHSKGIPRLLNLLAERSLLGVYSKAQQQVSAKIVDQASSEVFGKVKTTNKSNYFKFISVAAIVVLCVWLSISLVSKFNDSESPELRSASTTAPVLPSKNTQAPETTDDLELTLKSPSAVQQLFELWRPNSNLEVSTANLCESVVVETLRCEQLTDLSLADILSINKPGIVTLQADKDSLQRYLLSSTPNDLVQLDNVDSTHTLVQDEFVSKWQGDYLLLWQAPNGYHKALYPGMSNTSVVNWLKTELAKTQPEVAQLITGGIYSEALAQYVMRFQQQRGLNPDGILGMQTIMALTEAETPQPRLNTRGQD
ncbi:UNVERIFIED_CONTAM: hypothetical protein GTU68_046346 [Idotea baltica]|nr:hypothetical protein [Idotea baltica]